ncbi:hypothetical protein GGTG_10589 [Gaeumannomyces tritici R3-111a-1]|uniref:Uncharacterized protein n=1 Tax=Gaeumannomyces tritici (strain R3-111a-1) TaxID=644352 RepID=J3PAR4_GAET3|nr:hypothetical protein GGTG_10589 [Gaeumannomyces tritici R3-111a-1]EJT71330.1 hypothetical protein GGTG_10589 [Gaeumannomyces tritici R3-111a-1]
MHANTFAAFLLAAALPSIATAAATGPRDGFRVVVRSDSSAPSSSDANELDRRIVQPICMGINCPVIRLPTICKGLKCPPRTPPIACAGINGCGGSRLNNNAIQAREPHGHKNGGHKRKCPPGQKCRRRKCPPGVKCHGRPKGPKGPKGPEGGKGPEGQPGAQAPPAGAAAQPGGAAPAPQAGPEGAGEVKAAVMPPAGKPAAEGAPAAAPAAAPAPEAAA